MRAAYTTERTLRQACARIDVQGSSQRPGVLARPFRFAERYPVPDVHRPHLEDDEETAPRELPGGVTHRSKSVLKIGLEVLLIGTGVFLGLMGEQWRGRAPQRELPGGALRAFRNEDHTNT